MNCRKRITISSYTAATVAAAAIAVVAALVAAVVLASSAGGQSGNFTPPPFDPAATEGTPRVSETAGYGRIYREGMAFSAWVCGNPPLEGTALTVYLTNPAENAVWMKLRVLDAEGNMLGETGLIRPGEYVESVSLTRELPAGSEICMKIMTYEPHTYYSMGAITLNTRVGT